MKKMVSIFFAAVLTVGTTVAQVPTTPVEEPDTLVKPEVNTETNNPVVKVVDKKDTVSVKIGKKGVSIVDDEDGSTTVEIKPIPEKMEKNRKKSWHRHFNGHWQGFEIGMNNYLTPDYEYPDNFMALNTGRSWNVNLNILQYDQRLIGNTVGILTGLGFQFNDYKFSGNNTIGKDSTGSVIMLTYAEPLKMSKLNVAYLTIPIIMEIHAGRSFYIAGGVIGSMKIRSYTKVKYYVDGKIAKNKVRDDYAISPLQYEATVRVGIKTLNLYANYNLSPLFQKNKGPELYPFSVGLAVRFN